MPSRSRPSTLPLACVLVPAALGLGGCYTEGGLGFSNDQHVYVSRPWQPWTVTLRDTRTGQEFWSMDVPVGKRLIVTFSSETGTKDKYTPDTMHWSLVDEDRDTAVRLASSVAVPPANSRRLEPTLRTAPELPESMVSVTKGALPPAKVPAVRPPSVTVPVPTEELDLPTEEIRPTPPAPPAPNPAPGATRPG